MNFRELTDGCRHHKIVSSHFRILFSILSLDGKYVSTAGLATICQIKKETLRSALKYLKKHNVIFKVGQRSPFSFNPIDKWTLKIHENNCIFTQKHTKGRCVIKPKLHVPKGTPSGSNGGAFLENNTEGHNMNDLSKFATHKRASGSNGDHRQYRNKENKEKENFLLPCRESQKNGNCSDSMQGNFSDNMSREIFVRDFKESVKLSHSIDFLKDEVQVLALDAALEFGNNIFILNSMNKILSDAFTSDAQIKLKYILDKIVVDAWNQGLEFYRIGTKLYKIDDFKNNKNNLCRWAPQDYFQTDSRFLKVEVGRMNMVIAQIQDTFGLPPLNFEELEIISAMSYVIEEGELLKNYQDSVRFNPEKYESLQLLDDMQIIKLVEFLEKEIRVGV